MKSGRTWHGKALHLLMALAITLLMGGGHVWAQVGEVVDPRPYGFEMPAGRLELGAGKRVTTLDDQGRSVIAKVYVTVGDYQVLLLPDGQLTARPAQGTRFTERPFVATSQDVLAQRLTSQGPLKGFRTKATDAYLYVYNTSDEFETVTRRILERMLPALRGYARNRDIPTASPEVPLVVVMFRDAEQFQAYRPCRAAWGPITTR